MLSLNTPAILLITSAEGNVITYYFPQLRLSRIATLTSGGK